MGSTPINTILAIQMNFQEAIQLKKSTEIKEFVNGNDVSKLLVLPALKEDLKNYKESNKSFELLKDEDAIHYSSNKEFVLGWLPISGPVYELTKNSTR